MPETPTEREPAGLPGMPVAGRAVVRHAPRYRAFVLLGVVLGLLVGTLIAVLLGASGGPGPVIALVAIGAGLLGGWLGALVAVLIDRRSR